MTGPDETAVELDDNVLDRLAGLICGDDSSPSYRTGYQLTKFFEAAGWRHAGEVDGSRRSWTLDLLRSRRRDSAALRAVVLRLADPREYLDDDEARVDVVEELNHLLAVEGYQVVYRDGRPRLVTRVPTVLRPAMRVPVQLTANLTDIVRDDAFGKLLQDRLDEARTCWRSGAFTAAIIMLGSVLEGVLYDVAVSRHVEGKPPTDHLQSLIELADARGWLAKDVSDYAQVLRDHRNLVHPKKQWTQGYLPEDDTVRIAWNVVVAALNDLSVAE